MSGETCPSGKGRTFPLFASQDHTAFPLVCNPSYPKQRFHSGFRLAPAGISDVVFRCEDSGGIAAAGVLFRGMPIQDG